MFNGCDGIAGLKAGSSCYGEAMAGYRVWSCCVKISLKEVGGNCLSDLLQLN